MIGFYIFLAIAAGVLAAYALHRLNITMTRRALAGITPPAHVEAPERATGYSWASSATGARVAARMPAEGHSARPLAEVDVLPRNVHRPDEVVIDGEFRRYAATVPTGNATLRRYRRLASGDAATIAGPIELETRKPHREPTATADVGVPLAQALATAAIAALLCGVLSALAGRSDTLRVAGGCFAVTLAGAWLWRLGVVDSLLQTVERITQHDWDGDGDIGDEDTGHLLAVQPDKARQTVATETRQRSADDRLLWLISFVARCYTLGTSESTQGIKPGERAKYLEARDLLFRLGLAEWRSETNKRLGWDMTTTQAVTVKTLREHVTAV